MPSTVVEAAAEKQGIKERTLERAKQNLRIESVKAKDGKWLYTQAKKAGRKGDRK